LEPSNIELSSRPESEPCSRLLWTDVMLKSGVKAESCSDLLSCTCPEMGLLFAKY